MSDTLAGRVTAFEVEAMRTRLRERLDELAESLDERLAFMAASSGLSSLNPAPIELAIPAPLLDFLATAMAELDHAGRGDLVETLVLLYGESMPLTLATGLAGLDGRCPWLMHEPLALEQMPRLHAALRDLVAALDRVAPARELAPWERWFAAPLSLFDLYPTTFFGRLQPLFGTTPEVLLELAATAKDSRAAAIDRLLGPAILHEFLHFFETRAPLWPPYLDEAIAGGLGVHFLPETALPSPDIEAFEGFLTFAQVGLALIDLVGVEPVLMAQAGLIDWDELVPGLRRRALALYWPRFLAAPAAHLHPDWDDPRPFADLFDAAAPTPEVVYLRATRALAGASMTRSRPGRVVAASPPPTTFDFARGLMTTTAPHTQVSGRSGWPGATSTGLLHRLPGGPRFELPAGASAKDLRAAMDAAGLFDPS